MARSERETKEEEGRRLILKGLAMRPDLIGDLRRRVAVEAALKQDSLRKKERFAKRLKAAGLAAALAAAGAALIYQNRLLTDQRAALARSRAQGEAQALAQSQAQARRQAQALAQARQQAQQAAAQAQAQAEAQGRVEAAQAKARQEAKTQAERASRYGPAGIEWVRILGGTFMMGRRGNSSGDFSDAQPHPVTVPSFQMAKSLVTNRQYKACVAAGACTSNSDQGSSFDGDDQPVVGVDWDQARAFSRWAGGRLPSEAEWEYAARSGGKDWKYPWGDEDANCGNVVISVCGYNATAPVCSKPSGNTRQGLCDMAGNAWEWVEDWYHGSYNGAPTDGSAWVDPAGSSRVVRGGSWSVDSLSARSANRYGDVPGARYYNLGFRPAR